MTIHLGNVPASTTLYLPFATYDANGASVTMTGFAVGDILIYKNGSVTQRSSTAGFTLLDTDGIDFDGITGLHGFSIDLSDNTDAGFYAVGGFYWVVVSTVTVSTQVVTALVATFRLVAAEATVGSLPVTLSSAERNSVADALLDRTDGVETGLTPRQAFRVNLAATGGKVSGAATTTNTFRNAVADNKNRIVATVDVDGNRTAITYDLT